MSIAYLTETVVHDKVWDRPPQKRIKAELAQIEKRRAQLIDCITKIMYWQFRKDAVYSRANRIAKLISEYNTLTLRIISLELL